MKKEPPYDSNNIYLFIYSYRSTLVLPTQSPFPLLLVKHTKVKKKPTLQLPIILVFSVTQSCLPNFRDSPVISWKKGEIKMVDQETNMSTGEETTLFTY